MNDKLARLAKGPNGRILLEVLEDTKRQIADIRTPLKVKPELANEIRLGIIEAIDTFLVEKLKIASGEISPPNPNEHE